MAKDNKKPATPTVSTAMPDLSVNDRMVTIDVPMSIAQDKGKMDQVMNNVLHHLGCPGCHSGWDLRFRHLRDLTVDARTLAVTARGVVER